MNSAKQKLGKGRKGIWQNGREDDNEKGQGKWSKEERDAICKVAWSAVHSVLVVVV